MKRTILFCKLFVACSLLVNASPALIIGTPGNAQLAVPTPPDPSFGNLINFDSLVPGTSLASNQYASQGVASIASPDGLTVAPFSTQSFPNEIFDSSTNGSANLTIQLNYKTNEIGIGVADSDPVTITLQALAANGSALGSAFNVTIPANTVNPGNAYFVIRDTGYNIGGLQILQTAGSASFSGLAIDDLQLAPAPEPAALSLVGIGILGTGLFMRRKRS